MLAAAGWLLLFLGVGGVAFSFNALRPRLAPAPIAVASFFAGWLTAELALHVLAFQAFALAFLCWHGALATWAGRIGAVLSCTSIVLLLVSLRQSLA
jgi:hypothetical protein